MKPSDKDTKTHLQNVHERWLERSNRPLRQIGEQPAEWIASQCLHCWYYVPLSAPLGEDWGVCSNSYSGRDGLVMFEHDGCDEFRWNSDDWKEGDPPLRP